MNTECKYADVGNSLKDFLLRRDAPQHKKDVFLIDGPVSYCIFDTDGRQHYLVSWRKKIFSMLREIAETNQISKQLSLANYCRDINELFSCFLSSRVFELHSDVDCYLDEIKDFVESLGCISHLFDIYNGSNIFAESNGAACFAAHFYLQLYQQYMKFLYFLYQDSQDIGKELKAVSRTLQDFISSVLNNVVFVAYFTFKQQLQKSNISKKEIHSCKCFQQCWTTTIWIADKLNNCFWESLSEQLSKMFEKEDVADNTLLEFQICLLVKISPLYLMNDNLQQDKQKHFTPANWIYFQDLLKHVFLSENEDVLRTALLASLQLLDHWNVNNDIFGLLWDFFIKKLNHQWSSSGYKNFKSFTKVESNLQEKFSSITSIVESKDNTMENIFNLFLALLHKSITKATKLSNTQYIATVKRKIFSKFHKKQMEDLNIHGLNNFTSLFCVLSLSTSQFDVPKKMISLITLIPSQNTSTDFKKSYIISIFLVLLICRHEHYECSFILDRIFLILNDITKVLSMKISSKKSKENAQIKWEITTICLDSFEYCFSYQNFSNSDVQFLSFDYSNFLAKASAFPVHMSMLIRHIDKMLIHVLNNENNSVSDEVCEKLCINIYEPLKNVLQKDMQNKEILQCIAWFALITIEWKSPKVTFGLLITNYAFNAQISLNMRCNFITYLFNSNKTISYIENNELSMKVMSLWVELALTHTEKESSLLKDLTSKLHMLETCQDILPQTGNTAMFDVEEVLVKFVSSLGSKYYSSEDLFDMAQQKENINMLFKNFIKICEQVLTRDSNEKSILRILIKVCGYLVGYCAKAIYRKTEPMCLLPQILEMFLLPLPSKPLKKEVVKIVRENFHLFLFGMATLEFRKDEFIGRKLRRLHSEYFEGFACESNNVLHQNPFMLVLEGSFNKNTTPQVKSDYKQYLMEIIAKDLLTLQCKVQYLAAILHFVTNVLKLQWQNDDFGNWIEILVDKMLKILLLCQRFKRKGEKEPPNIRKYILECFHLISKKCNKVEVIQSSIFRFIKSNISQSEETVIDVLVVISSVFPHAVTNSMDFMTQQQIEKYDDRLQLKEAISESGKM